MTNSNYYKLTNAFGEYKTIVFDVENITADEVETITVDPNNSTVIDVVDEEFGDYQIAINNDDMIYPIHFVGEETGHVYIK